MTTVNDLEKVLAGELPKAVACDYLRLYLAEIEWDPHIDKLYAQLRRQYRNPEELSQAMRKRICCAMLLRAKQPTVPLDAENPESLLFRVKSFHQYNDEEWFTLFQNVVKRDLEIQRWRRQALALGVVDQIQFQPFYRQAYNWMYSKAEEGGFITEANKETIESRLRRLTQAYGGSVICNIFSRHNDAIKRVLNWRSGYFLERQIFIVYTPEQVMKIKKLELEQTNTRLIKNVVLNLKGEI